MPCEIRLIVANTPQHRFFKGAIFCLCCKFILSIIKVSPLIGARSSSGKQGETQRRRQKRAVQRKTSITITLYIDSTLFLLELY